MSFINYLSSYLLSCQLSLCRPGLGFLTMDMKFSVLCCLRNSLMSVWFLIGSSEPAVFMNILQERLRAVNSLRQIISDSKTEA